MRMMIVRLSGLIALASVLGACDSTVGLDPTRPTFTKVLVPGVCPLTEDGSRLRLSVLLLDGRSSLLPDSRIQREFEPVIQLLPKERFSFSKSSADTDVMGSEPGVVVQLEGDVESPQKIPTVLQTVDRQYAYAGGEARQADQRLVVLVLDHSGTLAGIDPLDGALKPEIRTDQRDERVTFFTQLVTNMPAEYKVAVVRMNDQDTKIEDCLAQNRNFDPCEDPKRLCSVGYVDKTPVACALKSLEAGEKGFTPLNDTLKEVFDLLLTRSYPTDNPIVIVFTDGMEESKDGMSGGDASVGYEVGSGMKVQSEGFNDILGPNQARDLYVNGVNGSKIPVPVVVMHLQPPASSPYKRGRDAKLQKLACDTGGEYVFLESASLLTKSSNLQTMISNRIRGVWQVDVDTSLAQPNFEDGDYLLSTSLQVTLGGVQRTADLSKSRDTQSIQDSRLWIRKSGN